MRSPDPLGLYISVPFCRAKCSFCNFASGVSSPARIDTYVAELCAEIDAAHQTAASLQALPLRTANTVYFGGGTPSLLDPAQLRRIFFSLHRAFEITPHAEITIEAAPDQISNEVLDTFLELGVNRVSLGVQSFIDEESRAVGRTHTAASCLAELTRLHEASVAELAIDLIAGLPYQTPQSWQHTLEVAVDSAATHISVYMLEVDEDSRLGLEILNNGPRLHAPSAPSADVSAALYKQACDFLNASGFPQYEISNFAAPAHQSQHNHKYWQREPYRGFGLDAHSMLYTATGAVRFANAAELNDYAPHAHAEVTFIDDRAAFEESVFLGLRLTEGIAIADIASRFGARHAQTLADASAELLAAGFMTTQSGRLALTARGRMISNDIFARLLAERVAA